MARMKYPGGFADDTPISAEVLARLFPEVSPEGWEDFAAKEQLPLYKEQRGWAGPALPFLVLLGLKKETPEEAYYRLLEKALGDPVIRGELEEVLRKLGNWAGVSPAKAPQQRAEKDRTPQEKEASPAPQEAQEVSFPSSSEEGLPPRDASPPPPPRGSTGVEASSPMDAAISLVVAAIGALEERLRALEEQVAELRAEVSASREEAARLQDEMEVWNEHVRYLNDRYAKAEEGIKEEQEARKKELSELASRLQALENLIAQIRRVVLPH